MRAERFLKGLKASIVSKRACVDEGLLTTSRVLEA